MKTIAVTLEGGLIQSATMEGILEDIQILIIDYDASDSDYEMIDDENTLMVPQGTNPPVKAWVSVVTVAPAGIPIAEILSELEGKTSAAVN